MKRLSLSFFAILAIAVSSCQDEVQYVRQDTSSNFSKSSPISSLICRVSQYETTSDNVLDGTSHCSVKLPAHVTVNSQYVYVGSDADFQSVEDIKNLNNLDDDEVHFGFPITIIYPNYQEHLVSSETEWDEIIAGYGDDSYYHEIPCLDFNYPISLNLYDTNNQVASTVAMQTDTQFYNFIRDLNQARIVGIVFPITLTNSSAQQLTINTISQLEYAINDALGDCNPMPTPASLSDVITTGTWHVSYCYYGNDTTSLYTGYNFTFNDNGNVTVVKNATTIDGDWDINNGTQPRLDLHFDGSALHDLETNWDVLEFTSTYIRLRESSGGSSQYYMSFTRN